MSFSATGISFAYAQTPILRNISLSLEPGEFVALLGPNGGGKSTLLKVLSGILAPTQGKVLIQDQDFLKLKPYARAQAVAYVSAYLQVEFPMTAAQAVLMGRTVASAWGWDGLRVRAEDKRVVQRAMQGCDCWDLRDRDVRELSGGERQLVHLARALAGSAKILLLDEALSQMDLHHQVLIGKMLRDQTRAQGYSVVLVAHDVNLASEWANRCVLLNHGEKIADGPIPETLIEGHLQILYPGAKLVIGKNPATGAAKVFFG